MSTVRVFIFHSFILVFANEEWKLARIDGQCVEVSTVDKDTIGGGRKGVKTDSEVDDVE